ncbi:TonB-dependent receptor [Bacteroides thetaiotaomicron]|jgi:iron complex outermembrane receptor protein|uniref:TonB-dependent receptor n=2 Tax=Bacteroides thetaiotaomicron TaxID=818 RepID=UPI001C8CB772|nr:TonB-dependent receptor [Bacteroides thetaiotaomicron]MCA6040636.1 outer membrane beta-barrel protein [Bacteroides thetaiotaomicron]
MKRFAVLFFSCILLALAMKAQNRNFIIGNVTDNNDNPIPDAVIMFRDSSSVTQAPIYSYSDQSGAFQVALSISLNQIIVSRIGYITKKYPLTFPFSLLHIKLTEDTTFHLEAIEIKAKRIPIKVKTDRLVYNIAASLMKDDNLMESFKLVPLLTIQKGKVAIIGKEQTDIYINGRKSMLSGEDMTAYLKSLSVDQIKSIEVIHSPSSSFRGEGDFGIININLKEKEDGLQGRLNAQFWKEERYKGSVDATVMFHKHNLSLDIVVGGSDQENNQKTQTFHTYKTDNSYISEIDKLTGSTCNGWGMGIFEWNASEKDIIGGAVRFSYLNMDYRNAGNAVFPAKMVQHNNDKYGRQTNATANLNYRKSLRNEKEWISIDLDYVHNYLKQSTRVRMDDVDETGIVLSPYDYYNQFAPQNVTLWSGKAEYQRREDAGLLQFGIDSYRSHIVNNDTFQQKDGDQYVNVEAQSNHFKMTEWTSALFFHAEKTWKGRFSLGLGVRIEYTTYSTKQVSLGESDKRDYWKFLPEIQVGYTLSPKHIFSYSLTNRIKRPAFALLNPFKLYDSAIKYSVGNPDLTPTNNFYQKIQYNFLNHFTLQCSYYIGLDQVVQFDFVKEDQLIEKKPVNVGKCHEFTALLNANASYWNGRATVNCSFMYSWNQMKSVSIGGDNFGWIGRYAEVYLNNAFILSKKRNWSFDFSLSGTDKRVFNQNEFPRYIHIDGQLKKKIGKWNFALYGYTNIYFYSGKATRIGRIIYDTDILHTVTLLDGGNSVVGLRLAYSFGNSKVKVAQRRKVSGEDAKSRL